MTAAERLDDGNKTTTEGEKIQEITKIEIANDKIKHSIAI